MPLQRLVLLGDVILSREITERELFQDRLKKACAEANLRFADSIQAGLKLIKGTDEIGAVLRSPRDLFGIINTILDGIFPYRIRFAAITDTVDVRPEGTDVTEMDGPAFHRAAAAIDRLRKSEFIFYLSTGRKEIDVALSNQVNLLYLLRQEWSPSYHQVLCGVRENLRQQEIAQRLHLTQQGVSRILKKMRYKQYLTLERSIEQQFRRHGAGGGTDEPVADIFGD